MENDWMATVRKTFKKGRLSNPSYLYKNALQDAKKYYKKGKNKGAEVIDTGKEVTTNVFKKVKKVTKKTRKALSRKVKKLMNKSKPYNKNKRRTNKNRK